MYVPFHDGIISQFEGYGDLEELDWEGYRRQYGNIQRLDRILEAENDDVNRYKASKQADVLMLLYLMSATELCELLERLGYRFMPDKIPEMVDYYLARTSHGSTLSGVVHTWVLARANRDRAMEYFQQALTSDVSDIQGGTTSEGVHLAAMAGSVDLMQRCFTGMETRSEPHHPLPALAGSTWRAGVPDPLPRSAPAPAGQRKGCDHQCGSARCCRSRSGMPWSSRSTDARDHCPISRLTGFPMPALPQPSFPPHYPGSSYSTLVRPSVTQSSDLRPWHGVCRRGRLAFVALSAVRQRTATHRSTGRSCTATTNGVVGQRTGRVRRA